MNFRFLYIILFLALPLSPVWNQTAIEKLTRSIIDTSETQTQQAEDIYQWVSTNIHYDIKSLQKGLTPNLTPIELIKEGKGLCSDYARLYQSMCRSVGIEAYIVSGYSKGYNYNKQQPFLRTNHAWNIIYTDSTWKHVDATWGGGYVEMQAPFFSKIMYKLFEAPLALSEAKYIKEYSTDYFDVQTDSLTKTHYPADPKWLFTPMPLSIVKFQNDTIDSTMNYLNYAEEITQIRGKSNEYVYEAEATNSKQFNALNYYNSAHAYYQNGLNFNIDRDIKEANRDQFTQMLEEQTLALSDIETHRAILDSVYQSRSNRLRQLARDQKRLTGRIKSKAKKAKNTHKSSQKKIVGKSSSYTKKMNGFQVNIGRTEIKKREVLGNLEPNYIDTADVIELTNEILNLRENIPYYNRKMDSLFEVVDNFAFVDAQIDDSIGFSNFLFNANLNLLYGMILSSDEALIIDYVDTLKVINQDIEDFLKGKKMAKTDLQNTGREYYSYSTLLQKNYKAEMSLNLKLQKLTAYPDSTVIAYNEIIDELILCYKQAIVFTKKLNNHNNLQSEIREENLKALKHHKKNINRENKFFVKWYENHIAKERTQYAREKELAKKIKSASTKNQKLIESKLKKYELAQEKEN